MIRAERRQGAKYSRGEYVKNVVRFENAVLRYRSFEMRKLRYASDEGKDESLRSLWPLTTSAQGKLGVGSCMTAGLGAYLSARRAEAAGLKAAFAGWVARAGDCKTADGKAVRAASAARAGGCKVAGWIPLRKFSSLESCHDKDSPVVLLR